MQKEIIYINQDINYILNVEYINIILARFA